MEMNFIDLPAPKSGFGYRVQEFAVLTGQGLTKVWADVHGHKLGSLKLGNKVFIPISDAKAYISKCYRPAQTETTPPDRKQRVIERIAKLRASGS